MDSKVLQLLKTAEVRCREQHAGYSVTAVVVIVALIVIVLLIWWQATMPVNTLNVGDDPGLILDRETQGQRQLATSTPTTTMSDVSTNETATMRNYTRAELSAIQTRLETEEDYEAALQEVEELESELARTYDRSAGATREGWNELRADLDELEDRLRESSADTLGVFADLIRSLEQEVRVDESEQ